MNRETSNSGFDEAVPAELAGIASALNALGAADRAAADAGLESRVAAATGTTLRETAVRPTLAAVEALAHSERSAARSTLEDRLFIATRASLSGHRPEVVVVRRMAMVWRAAAVVAIAGLGALVWSAIRPAPSPARTDLLASSVESEIKELAALADRASNLPDFDDLHRDLDTLDRSVRGDWFRSVTTTDEESL